MDGNDWSERDVSFMYFTAWNLGNVHYKFCDLLSDVTMASFDVTSLFGNILVDENETIQSITNQLFPAAIVLLVLLAPSSLSFLSKIVISNSIVNKNTKSKA